MRAEQLLRASAVHLAAGDANVAVDSAIWAYGLAVDASDRASAAAAAALGFIDENLPAEAIIWADRALSVVAGHRIALTCRGLGHRALGRLDEAMADLDVAVAVSSALVVPAVLVSATSAEPSPGAPASGAVVVPGQVRGGTSTDATLGPAQAASDAENAGQTPDGAPQLPVLPITISGMTQGLGSAGVLIPAGPVPVRARFARALILDELGRRDEAYQEMALAAAAAQMLPGRRARHLLEPPAEKADPLDTRGDHASAAALRAADDRTMGRLVLRIRGTWRLADGDHAGAVGDFATAARFGDRRSLAALLDLTGELPTDSEIRLTRLVALRISERPRQGLELARAMLADPELDLSVRAEVLLNRGHLTRAAEGAEAAVDWFVQAVETNPDDAEILVACGHAQAMAGRPGDAARTLMGAVTLAPGTGHPECAFGELYESAGEPARAAEWYGRALAVVPCDRRARFGYGRAMTESGRLLAEPGRTEEGHRYAQLAAVSGHADAVEWCHDHDVAVPEDEVTEALDQLRDDGNPFSAERKLREVATRCASHSVGAGDLVARFTAKVLCHAARCELAMGEPSSAEHTIAQAIELHPTLVEAWEVLGQVLVALNREEDAIAVYQQCAWCDPRYPGALAGAADVLCRLGRGGDALEQLDRAVEIGYPDDPDRQRDLYRRRACVNQALGRWQEATADVERLVDSGLDADEVGEWVDGLVAIRQLVDGGASAHQRREYRTYGLARDEWDGYSGIDWPWRLQFAETPDPSTRIRLAAAVGRSLGAALNADPGLVDARHAGPSNPAARHQAEPTLDADLDIGVTLRWSDRFLLVRVRVDEGGNLGALRAPLMIAVGAMHRECPLVEAVNLAARGVAVEDDPAEAWSVATQPVPDPGPDFGIPPGFWVTTAMRAADFEEPFTDPEADAGLRTALTGAGQAGEISLVMIDSYLLPVLPPSRDLGSLRRYPNDIGRFADNGAGVVLRRPGEFCTGLDRVTADGRVYEVIESEASPGSWPGSTTSPRLAMSREIDAVSVAPGGARAMFATGLGHDLYLLDLGSGEAAALLEGVPRIEASAFLDDETIMVKTAEWIAVFELDPTGPRLLARDFASPGSAVVCAGGRVIIVGCVREPELVVYGFAERRLGRLAEVSGPINCYRVWTAGDRAFAADRSIFELVGLVPAWQRFAAWATTVSSATIPPGLVVKELEDAPYTGIGDGLDAIKDDAFWCVRGEAGLLMAVRETDEGHEILVGDSNGVHPASPALRESGFEYDWRPDGRALLIRGKDSATVWEVNVGLRRARPVSFLAQQACYTATGFAVLRERELVLYGWQHGSPGEPMEMGRYPVPDEATTLGWADGGRVLHLTAGGHTGLYLIGRGVMYPIGAFEGEDWFSGWNHGDALYFANRHSGRDFRAYRVSGFRTAVVEALGRTPVERLRPSELPPVRRVNRLTYPDTTCWRYFSDA